MSSPVLRYYEMGHGVTAFSSTRHGGCGKGTYGSFNVNRYCGDEPAAVAENRRMLCAELGIGTDGLIIPHQTHGTVVRRIAAGFVSLSDDMRDMLLEGVDAVMTDVKGICVGVSTADCIPILLYDARHGACCAVHAGWRGTVARIVERAVYEMSAHYGTQAEVLTVVIGPGISQVAFEVGDEVYEAFAREGFMMERIARRYDKWHIDLWECNRIQLISKGVNPDKIFTDGTCTYKNGGEFFSARRLGTGSGRIFTGIMMK